ncbi:MAG: tetratricopeptide repeat protein [Armatimonadota bacterium]
MVGKWFAPMCAALFLVGCDGAPLGASLGSRESRERRSFEMVRSASEEMALGDAATARSRIDNAISVLGGDVRARTEVARQLLLLGRHEAAERVLYPLLSRDDVTAVPALSWGVLAVAAGRKGDAGTEARARDRARTAASAERAAFGARPRQDLERARLVRRLLDLADYHDMAPVDASAVVAACREAVEVARQSPIARARLARALADHGTTSQDRREAAESGLLALQYAAEQGGAGEQEAMLKDAYGWALVRRGESNDIAAARRVLAEAIDADPENASVRFHYGVALRSAGLLERAAVEFGRAVLLRPDYTEAREARRQVETMPGFGAKDGGKTGKPVAAPTTR